VPFPVLVLEACSFTSSSAVANTNKNFIPLVMCARRHVSIAREMFIEHFAVLHAIYIDQTPSWNAAAALSPHLPTKQADNSILNTVVMRLNDSLIALIPEPDQLFVSDGLPKHLIQFLIDPN